MLGTFRPKQTVATNNKPLARTTKSRSATSNATESGPKTRSSSSRRAQDQQITITYLGRSRAASESDLPASSSSTTSIRSRRPAASKAKAATSGFSNENELENLSSPSSPDSSLITNSSMWESFKKTINGIGAVAKRENKHIRRLKELRNKNSTNYEKDVASDFRLTLVAIQMMTNHNLWSLSSCYEFLPIIIENITSENEKNQSIALDGLEAIADTWLERIIQFAQEQTRRIGVDVAAEERAEKARECVKLFRGIVKKRDILYKQMNEKSIFKLDGILEQLKRT